jgi:hypothetical protein
MRSLAGWLLIIAGWVVGLVGVVLIATGFLAIIGLPLVAVAALIVALGFVVPSRRVEELDMVPAPSMPLVVSVVGIRGICPRGYQLGNTWQLDATGRVSPPLCRPAVVALRSTLEEQSVFGKALAVCRCPLGSIQVTFAVTAPNGEAKAQHLRDF